MGSREKSWTLSAFFSQTMSRCPCSAMLRAWLNPGKADFFTTTFPKWSCLALNPSRFAVSMTYSAIACSCFEQRGMRAISAKYFQTSCGLRPSIALDNFGSS